MADVTSDSEVCARVWFLDVDKGDCTLLLDVGTRRAILVDCPSRHVETVARLLALESAVLDTVIVTHWDIDHYGGASRLALSPGIRRVLYNHDTLFAGPDSPKQLIRGTLKNFLNVPSPREVLGAAVIGQTGAVGSVSWEILAPTHSELTAAYVAQARNVASSVVDVRAPGLRLLIGGDAVGVTWDRLIRETDLKADILRWPHHGATLAGDEDERICKAMLAAVRPHLVIMSTDAVSSYGHPAWQSIRAAVDASSSVLCTEVTAGCFGYLSKNERNGPAARGAVHALTSRHCAGTVSIECRASTYTVSPSADEHEGRIAEWPSPLCRRKPADN